MNKIIRRRNTLYIISLCTSIILLTPSISFNQNLIPNPSFEEIEKYNLPQDWTIIAPSADLIKSGHRIFPKTEAKKYDRIYREYFPSVGSDGDNYICLFKLTDGSEAIAARLDSQLERGMNYEISMDVYKPHVPGKYPLFEMGVSFMEQMPERCSEQECFTDQGTIVSLSNNTKPILHEDEWINVSGNFVASGDEAIIALFHPECLNRPINKPDHLLAYLFDNIQLRKSNTAKCIDTLYFEQNSANLSPNQIDEIHKLKLDGLDSIKVVGYSSMEGNDTYNTELSLLRASNTVKVISKSTSTKTVAYGAGELQTPENESARKVEIYAYEKQNQQATPSTHAEMTSLIKELDILYRKDQFHLKNYDKHSTQEKLEHRQLLDNTIDSILNIPDILSYKLDNRSESNLINCYLHTSDSVQFHYYIDFKKYYELGHMNKGNWPNIIDRYKFLQDLPQIFGTQLHDTNGAIELYKIEDPTKVDSLRKAYGLIPLEEYIENIKDR